MQVKLIFKKFCHFLLEKAFNLFFCVSIVVRIFYKQDLHVMIRFLNKFKLCNTDDAVGNLHQVQGRGLRAVFVSNKIVDPSLYGFNVAYTI